MELSDQGGTEDLLRTHCPGPSYSDVFGTIGELAVAHGVTSVAQLLAPETTLTVTDPGDFSGVGYRDRAAAPSASRSGSKASAPARVRSTVRRLRSLLLGLAVPVLLTLAVAPAAQAQSTSVSLFGLPGGKLVSETDVHVTAVGQIVVSFHGDRGAGCATYGLCPYSGTIVVRPGNGDFAVLLYRQHGRLKRQADSSSLPARGGTTRRRTSSGRFRGSHRHVRRCRVQWAGQPRHFHSRRSRHDAALPPEGTALSTRCAGPLDGDLAGADPP